MGEGFSYDASNDYILGMAIRGHLISQVALINLYLLQLLQPAGQMMIIFNKNWNIIHQKIGSSDKIVEVKIILLM